MRKTLMVVLPVLMIVLSGCNGLGIKKEQIGTVTGGVLGGVLGNQVGKGGGRVAATIIGTLLGGYAGGAIGRSMDEVDAMELNMALEASPNHQPTSWTNPDTNARYVATPTRTYGSRARPCRDYTMDAVIDGKHEIISGRACRNGPGSWVAE